MPEEYIKVVQDPQTKIWKSVNYPYGDIAKLSIGEKFLQTMRSVDPNKIIDHFYDTNTTKTAKDVYEQSILIAINLQRLGIKKGDCVIFYSMNNEWVAVLSLGCILIGALPNYCEVHLDEESTTGLFDLLEASAIFYEEKYLKKIQGCLANSKHKNYPQLIVINGEQQPNVKNDLLKQPEHPIDFDNFKSVEIKDTRDEIAILALTSGSTGLPKIVQITHALMLHGITIWWDNDENYAPLDENSVVFSFSPLRWISQVAVMLQSMLFGIKRVSSCGAPTGEYGFAVLRSSGITHLFVAPSIYHEILLQLDENDKESLKSIRSIQLGGEPASKVILELSKKHAVNAKNFHCYGMTEMSTVITNDIYINGGKPLPGYEVQILDDQCRPLVANQPGQIALRPPYPLKGYKSLDNSVYYNEQGLFVNGDYGLIDERGRLHVLARYKDLIKNNGEVIIPNALEYIAINIPEIYVARMAGYCKTPNDPNEVAAFFVVLNSNVTASQNEISAKIMDAIKPHLNERQLAMIEKIYFVDSIPLTTCGKVDRVALRKLAACKA
ncbi:2-hydroxy-7-methoxy-5-methyl-1-naphthoate--CoA ligase-like [Musca vetustissima]|uniref:2-hydroxy-7-methoxy-5-methyl-1-naphthoate--CoA ligase-like n=1 Tax=Musca vetustissima TaxID=27455 RepID=UPI002AB60B5D|nr:2-hydroxy-7-methoxy-5-methyl-1-naphthoate--CoA ligase-like [Musca vetustissima]